MQQPSEQEIQREVENLLDIRRRSTISTGGIIDPDLPEQLSPTSSQVNGYWDKTDGRGGARDLLSDEDEDDLTLSPGADDPSSLFWVPARLHPEIAPTEFSAFLKEHTRVAADGTLERAPSVASSLSLGRKKSMLRNQYRPTPGDGVEEETVKPLGRTRSKYNNVPQLSISDLQRLEELAEEASKSDDPTKLRSVLRRSMSLNVAPSVIDKMDDIPTGDEPDAPIIVPPPGQILRRNARTKMRKPGIEGTGSTRFSARRRTSAGARVPDSDPRSSSDLSSSDHGDESVRRPGLPRSDSSMIGRISIEEEGANRPHSMVTEIYDAYAAAVAELDEEIPRVVTSPPPASEEPPPPVPVQASSAHARQPIVHEFPRPQQPQQSQQIPIASPRPVVAQTPTIHPSEPQRMLSPTNEPPLPSRTPSPENASGENMPYHRSPLESPVPGGASPNRKDKDKKGLFKWGGDKGGKKGSKEKEREREKEKDSGFFGSLFGSGKKKQEEHSPGIGTGASGRETAAALLGASKAKPQPTSPSPGPGGSYARYPIHVERAIYRLSHIKLANPRRPLTEQVLISNLMFWYLGVINKAQTQPATSPENETPAAQVTEDPTDKEKREREQREKEDREKAERDAREKEERERLEQQKRDSRRGTLTKAPPPGRRAEMPVRGPQYEMQHRSMEHEYGYGHGPPASAPPVRTGGAAPPPVANTGPYGYQRDRTNSAPGQSYSPAAQPQPQPGLNNFYYENNEMRGPQRTGSNAPQQLPPGAMAPHSMDQSWNSNPGHNQRSRTPPAGGAAATNRYAPAPEFKQFQQQQLNGGGAALKGRSLSATAIPQMANGGAGASLPGKPASRSSSAHAAPPRLVQPRPRTAEASGEEDLPLAVYQQQRRR